MSRNLYECHNARVGKDGYIYCYKGHRLGGNNTHIRHLKRGDRLTCRTCQGCPDVDFERMEYPNERGWK